MAKKPKTPADTDVEAYLHEGAKRRNIPTAENQSLVPDDDKAVKVLRYPRNPDLDPQLVWRGKDKEDGEPLEVAAPPIYIQEKIHPRALIENLRKQTASRKTEAKTQTDWFHDFNGLADPEAKTEFIDDDYNEESFFVRQAYFVGQNPYDSLKRALKAEIDEEAWEEMNATVSSAFPKPANGRICVKVINHFGDEVQKVFEV